MMTYARGRRELKVGMLVIAGFVSFTALFLYSTNRTLGAERITVFARLAAADGLQKGDAVLLRGVRVGEVKALNFDRGDVIVRIKLFRAVPLDSHTRADLVAADMFGRQTIVLRPGHGRAPALAAGDTLHGRGPVALTARLEGLGQQANRLLADSTIQLFREALSGAGQATTSGADAAAQVGALAGTASELIVEQRAALGAITQEAAHVARNLREATEPQSLNALRARLDSSAVHLGSATARMDTVASSLTRILASLEAGEGSAGRLLRDPELYERATGTLASLERLFIDVRENPKRYVTIKVF